MCLHTLWSDPQSKKGKRRDGYTTVISRTGILFHHHHAIPLVFARVYNTALQLPEVFSFWLQRADYKDSAALLERRKIYLAVMDFFIQFSN